MAERWRLDIEAGLQHASCFASAAGMLAIWHEHRAARLFEGAGGARTLEKLFNEIDTLAETADERGETLLAALYDYAEAIAPERNERRRMGFALGMTDGMACITPCRAALSGSRRWSDHDR